MKTEKKKEIRIQSAIKWFNRYEGNGLSRPYNSAELAAEAAVKYPKNYVETFSLDLTNPIGRLVN